MDLYNVHINHFKVVFTSTFCLAGLPFPKQHLLSFKLYLKTSFSEYIMSEEEQHVPSQEEEVKTEDPNATINIKVGFFALNKGLSTMR